jgi:NifU-like protein involved in Fe-S cluster formation
MDFSKLDDRFIRHVNMPSNLGVIELPSGRALGVGQCGDSVEVTLTVIDQRIAAPLVFMLIGHDKHYLMFPTPRPES